MAKAAEKAYQTVRSMILSGAYPAAARITELEVAAVAGVSRTPVREALRRLHAEGLVEFVPHQGAVVIDWTAEDRDDVFEMRALLESYGAARAARRVTDADVAELNQYAVDHHYEAITRGEGFLSRIGELNSTFHRRIYELAGSPRLVTALATLIEAPAIMRTFSAYQEQDLIRSAAHHLEIVRALEARDPDWAASIMRAHVLGARGALRFM
jgi:DNA-binding GntR family transcriptional regulator